MAGAEAEGEAWRRVTAGEPIAVIVEQVRQIVGDRRHVLLEAAGVAVGAWSVRPDTRSTQLLVAGILLEAAGGRDLESLTRWVEVGRERALQPPHTASVGVGRPRQT